MLLETNGIITTGVVLTRSGHEKELLGPGDVPFLRLAAGYIGVSCLGNLPSAQLYMHFSVRVLNFNTEF